MRNSPNSVLETALEWVHGGASVAIATVVSTWGSAPCGIGSQMVVSKGGDIEGSVSGGCVEGAVVFEAMEAIEDGVVRHLEYGVSDEDSFQAGLACGGIIRLRVDPVGGTAFSVAELADLCARRAARRSVCLAGDTARLWLTEHPTGGEAFALWFHPSRRLAIVGAVHIAQTLVPMAQVAGFDVTVMDPRASFATEARFPTCDIICDDTETAIVAHGVDAATAVVVLAHDPKIDDAALTAAIDGSAFYIGCLGSARTHAKRIARLREQGRSDSEMGRLIGPIGLDIGAEGPNEIAISVVAELVAARRGKLHS